MLDIALIRNEPERVATALARRGLTDVVERVLELDRARRAAMTEMQQAQSRRNEASKAIGKAKQAGEDAQPLIDEVAALKSRLAELEADERRLGEELDALMMGIPNLPAEDVPDGADESGNVLHHDWGRIGPDEFSKVEHFEIGESLGKMDFEAAARMSGSRFVVLAGDLARLERAIGQFMLDLQTREHGYTEMAVPYIVRSAALEGTGQLPKFAEDLYRVGDDHWLISTAEVPLTNLWREQILDEESLPRRVTALTPCFRSEAGAAGKDTRGMIRQHQFNKVELVSVTRPEDSADELERMLACAEEVLRRLDIPYRVMTLCAGDMGFSAQTTLDIEAWLPGQGQYREISSCSLFGDFQARRMKLRCRPAGEKKTRHPHTLNGSGLAVGRTLIAVMENYQQPDGSIAIPDALRPYMHGQERISA